MNPAVYEQIVDAINDRPWDDPGRYEACLGVALDALGKVALSIDNPEAERVASNALMAMWHRVDIGEWEHEDQQL